MYEVKESDWRLFRERLPGWQESCMEQLIDEYTKLLSGDGKASDKVWELEKRILRDRQKTGVCAGMSRSNMVTNTPDIQDSFSHRDRPSGSV